MIAMADSIRARRSAIGIDGVAVTMDVTNAESVAAVISNVVGSAGPVGIGDISNRRGAQTQPRSEGSVR